MILTCRTARHEGVGAAALGFRAARGSASALPARFFGDPLLLVLDEPNSNLDAAGQAR